MYSQQTKAYFELLVSMHLATNFRYDPLAIFLHMMYQHCTIGSYIAMLYIFESQYLSTSMTFVL